MQKGNIFGIINQETTHIFNKLNKLINYDTITITPNNSCCVKIVTPKIRRTSIEMNSEVNRKSIILT